MYTAARFIIYFCVSPCDESGLKQVQRNPFPPCALGGVTGVLHTRLPNPRRPPRSHHCGTRRENKAKTKARRRNKSYADIRALLGQPSRRACDNAKRGTQFVSRLPRTVVVSFSLLPPPPFSPSFFRYRNTREIRQFPSIIFHTNTSFTRGERNRSVVVVVVVAYVRDGTMQLEESS